MESHLSLPCSFFGRVEILVHLIVTLFDLRLIRLSEEAFALTAIGNLLPEGPGQRQIYKFRASAFRGCPNSEC